jgi:hypothetical protein
MICSIYTTQCYSGWHAGCDSGYHTYCVGLDHIPEGEWYCQVCQEVEDVVRVEEEASRVNTAVRQRTRSATRGSSNPSNPSRARSAGSSSGARRSWLRASLMMNPETGTLRNRSGSRRGSGRRGSSITLSDRSGIRASRRIVRQAASVSASASADEVPGQDPSVAELEDDLDVSEYDLAAAYNLSDSSIEILEDGENDLDAEAAAVSVSRTPEMTRQAVRGSSTRQRRMGMVSSSTEAEDHPSVIPLEEESLHQRLRRHLLRRTIRSAVPTAGGRTAASASALPAVRSGSVLEAREAMHEMPAAGWRHLGSSSNRTSSAAAAALWRSGTDGTRMAPRLTQHVRAEAQASDDTERSWEALHEAIRIERDRKLQADREHSRDQQQPQPAPNSHRQHDRSGTLGSNRGSSRGWHERRPSTRATDVHQTDQDVPRMLPDAAASPPGSAARLRAARAWAHIQLQQQRGDATSGGTANGRVVEDDDPPSTAEPPSRRELSAAQLARLDLEQV